MQIVPIQDVYSQQVQVTLAGQQCAINIYQLSTGLFCDLYVNSAKIISGVICLDRNLIVRDSYLGFIGDIAFADTQGTDDPTSPGLNSRFYLCYLDTFDLAPA
jgi:hypothetical protein